MSIENQKDRDLIGRIAEHTGLTASAIAQAAGMSASTLTRVMVGGSRLSASTVEKLEARFPDVFEREKDSRLSGYAEVDVLPSYAGMGGGGTGDGDHEVALVPLRLIEERLRARAQDLLIIDVRGDSMEPHFKHGDQIMVDKRDRDPSQPGPFALFDGDAYVVKLVERIHGRRGWYRVFSANPAYSPYEVEEADINILGRPVWYSRAL